ncbi:MAG: NAD-dependent DNA ligase LigA [Patescibacteria group bacterium]
MIPAEIRDRIAKLREAIDRHRYLYHVEDKQELSDEALDSLKKELFDFEQKYPELITSTSPTQRVAGKPLDGFIKVPHPGRMISLNDAFSETDMRAWLERLEHYLGRSYIDAFYCDLKMDGLAIELRYERGVLVLASTRGDGMVGEDVTQNVRTVDAVPLQLRSNARLVPETLLVRGELFLKKSEFERINKALQEAGEKPYANPRNLAAGTIRQLDPAIPAGRKLSFYAYSVVGPDGVYGGTFSTHADEYCALREWGIATNPHGRVARDFGDMVAFYHQWERKRDALDYEFDGTVISINNNTTYRDAGIVGKSPRGAIAFKFPPREAHTIIEDIRIQVGRTGVLTPVAHLRPVGIGGTVVTRATLHNIDEIARLDVRIGDTVVVGRAGDVIPDILRVLPEMRTGKEKVFSMPKKCPVCATTVVRADGQVAFYCPNDDCPAKQRERLYHFVSRHAFNIDGLGPKTIDQLVDSGLITNAADLFFLKEEDLRNLEGFAETASKNVIAAIQSRRTISLARFIFALGIPQVGEETARSLAVHFGDVQHVASADRQSLEAVPDVGPVVAASITEWFTKPYHAELLSTFGRGGVVIQKMDVPQAGKLSGKSFVVTGSLDSLSRDQAKERIRVLGGTVSESVSKKTSYVVVGDDPGSKAERATALGVPTLSEEEFLKLVQK